MLSFFRSTTVSKSFRAGSLNRLRMVSGIPATVREDVLPVAIYGPFELSRSKR